MTFAIIFILAGLLEVVIVFDRAETNPNKAMFLTMGYGLIAAVIIIYYVDNNLLILADILGSGLGRNIAARLVKRGSV